MCWIRSTSILFEVLNGIDHSYLIGEKDSCGIKAGHWPQSNPGGKPKFRNFNDFGEILPSLVINYR